jgi:hypothetical protein
MRQQKYIFVSTPISDSLMEFAVDEEERLLLIGEKDKDRKKKDKREKKKMRKEMDKQGTSNEEEAKETSKTVEMLQKELDEMRSTIAKMATEKKQEEKLKQKKEYALGFTPEKYLALGFIESANWISEKIAMKMKERMVETEGRWEVFKMIKPPDMRSIVTCASFNRGEVCRMGKWHTVLKKINKDDVRVNSSSSPIVTKEELRVHACTLCLKALGVLCMHSVLECPWIIEENWN